MVLEYQHYGYLKYFPRQIFPRFKRLDGGDRRVVNLNVDIRGRNEVKLWMRGQNELSRWGRVHLVGLIVIGIGIIRSESLRVPLRL